MQQNICNFGNYPVTYQFQLEVQPLFMLYDLKNFQSSLVKKKSHGKTALELKVYLENVFALAIFFPIEIH